MARVISNDWKNLDRAHVWHPYTRVTHPPQELPNIVCANGIYLEDESGRLFVDAISSWWCCALGHGRREVIEAIQGQAAELQHSILGNLTHPLAIRLAERLAHLMPTPERHILFASDGASAVEQALKIALQYQQNRGATRRTRFACIEGAYHGDTLGAMGVGYVEEFHHPFKSALAQAVALPFPANFSVAQKILDAHADELAAIIVEPLCLGAAGMKMYPAEWLRALGAWANAAGVPLIVDEIAMGFGRTGRMFAFQHAEIDPDIVCVGKALSAGYLPISATIAKDYIYDTFEDAKLLQHGHTFSGNPIAAAAALATLDIYERENIVGRAEQSGRLLHNLIQPLAKHPAVREIRCLGMIAAVELAPREGLSKAIRQRLQQHGILLRPLGFVVYLMPPLTIAENELQDLVEALNSAVSAAWTATV